MQSESCGNEALSMLSRVYHKILKVNLTRDSHEDLKVNPDEINGECGYADKLSDWMKGYAQAALVHRDDIEKYLIFTDINRLRQVFLEGKTYVCCHYRRKVNGAFRWVAMELVTASEYCDDNQIVYLYIKDIHDEYVSDIEEMDFLTGGLNRQGFLRQARLFLNSADSAKNYAIVLFNIKGFKGINEMFGTSGGDEALRAVYNYFKSSSLEPVMSARIEGDCFLCLVDQEKLNYSILPQICKTDFTRDNKSLQIHTHCGVYLITDRSVDISTMCDYAKIAISHIFDEYIKCYAIFDSHMRRDYIINLEVRGRIQEALNKGEFEVYYQPVFDAYTGELASAEALIRWNYPQHGLLSPGIFIPVLEESGHISQVDHFVLDEVRRFYEKRRNEGKHIVPISINLSWMDFYDSEMMEAIFESLHNDRYGIQARFEVTETSCAAMYVREVNAIAALQEAGAMVLLDDFGSGYSSFSTFSNYDFDIIKLDMGFVQKIGTDDKIKSIIHSIIDMSHHMNAKVIAEGVETHEQLDFLSRHGCDYIQGFYFSKPVPQKEFEAMLELSPNKRISMPLH